MHKLRFLSLVVLALAATTFADDWAKQYAVGSGAQLQVIADDAHLRVVASDKNEIAVRVTTEGYRIVPPTGAMAGSAASGELRIGEQQTGDRVELQFRTPRNNWGWHGGRRVINVEISVPRKTALDLRTGDGHIDVRDVSGDLKLVSGDGHITGEGLDGTLRVTTGDGHINVRGRFDLMELGTGDGRVEADAKAGSKIGAGWRVHTGDGSVTLRLPSDFSADLDAHTGDGHITLDLPVTVAGRITTNGVRGRLGNGGGQLYIRTGDGSIRLERGSGMM